MPPRLSMCPFCGYGDMDEIEQRPEIGKEVLKCEDCGQTMEHYYLREPDAAPPTPRP